MLPLCSCEQRHSQRLDATYETQHLRNFPLIERQSNDAVALLIWAYILRQDSAVVDAQRHSTNWLSNLFRWCRHD
jgi:hypothetical protein